MKTLYSILFLTLTLSLSSCADLDLYPLDTGSSDSWYKTEEEVKAPLPDFTGLSSSRLTAIAGLTTIRAVTVSTILRQPLLTVNPGM